MHARLTGLSSTEHLIGVNKVNRKLSDSDVIRIRNNYKPRCREFGARALSRKYLTAHSTILKIVNNKRYLDVFEDITNDIH